MFQVGSWGMLSNFTRPRALGAWKFPESNFMLCGYWNLSVQGEGVNRRCSGMLAGEYLPASSGSCDPEDSRTEFHALWLLESIGARRRGE